MILVSFWFGFHRHCGESVEVLLTRLKLSYRWRGASFRNFDNVFHKFKLVISSASG